MRAAQEPASQGQHHRPVPPNEHFEGGLIALADEALQQHAVIDAGPRLMDKSAQVREDHV